MTKKFYITIAIPYVNGQPHVGHALEFIQGDTITRFHKLLGDEVFFVTGSDENGLKIVRAAEKENLTSQQLADRNTKNFQDFARALNVQFDTWRRGSDKQLHWPGSEKLWQLCFENGDIYKKNYGGYYCVGCEDFYTKKDLIDGKCPEHLTEPEWVEEENYFFKLSKYQTQIEELITSNKLLIIPQTRRNEILSFIKSGLQDFSISRSKERAKNWGIPVPGDKNQVIYTWFDALNVYQTAVGFGYDQKLWQKWWPADIHVIGKGILRFHAVYWIGMLLSAKLPLPKSIFVHGYVSSGGHKMSKSLGNVIDPFIIVNKYGIDAVRYYFLREIPAYSDGDFSENRFKELYNADLANGLGNLVARVVALVSQKKLDIKKLKKRRNNRIFEEITPLIEQYRFDEALKFIWGCISGLDTYINKERPWELKPELANKRLGEIIVGSESLTSLLEIAYALQPFLPETAERILKQFAGPNIKSESPLFPRL